MESLSDTKWDVVISETGLQHSLLALALSRSDKKVLHVDENEYYGGSEAAFSLQEVDEWVDKLGKSPNSAPFRNATLWKTEETASESSPKLSFSRAYTLTLSPQIIYTKSKLLTQLVSSKVYRQLEFQAVGNWWIYDANGSVLKRLPNGREDIFQDKNIDNKAKRNLMKFLKFVVDYENQTEVWEGHGDTSLNSFLSTKYQFPLHLQTVISALTLSLSPTDDTTVRWALPRIARHLTSIGIFGPGFGAVFPKWGGGAEIAQVACRAGAVGGGVYVLGTGIANVEENGLEDDPEAPAFRLTLSNDEIVGTKLYFRHSEHNSSNDPVVSKAIYIISSPVLSIFKTTVEGSPPAAVSVIAFSPETLRVEGAHQANPIYIMVHSSETGECPVGQCVLYATTLHSAGSKDILAASLKAFLQSIDEKNVTLLYSLYYDQTEDKNSPMDLSFDDKVLEKVEQQWNEVMGGVGGEFMKFGDRKGMEPNDDDNGDNDDY
ncbi:rab geranylgeranyl transferase escort protein-like protein [Amylocarpus encephaloides]|uniref:Rab proteins geranylgeranyltransferase n=1 Tax=Amylocarpus encephaloides TaxID=45428 RepID=A0A9P7YJ56_9HELO|nr:rab geranylgeranyl transferase escort protein-like protein [Amylocarpus encephaloides]